MWETMFSQNQTMENVLRETFGVLQEWKLRRLPGFIADDNCIPHLAVSYWTRPCSSSGPCVCLCPSTPKGKERLLGAARHRALRGPGALHSHSCPRTGCLAPGPLA